MTGPMSNQSLSPLPLSASIPLRTHSNFSVDQGTIPAESHLLKDFRQDPESPVSNSDGPSHYDGTEEYGLEDGYIHGESDGLIQSSTTGNTLSSKPSRRTLWRSVTDLCYQWTKGPDNPRPFRIQSSEWLQDKLNQLMAHYLPGKWVKIAALLVLYLLWVAIFVLILRRTVSGEHNLAYGAPLRLSCSSTLWPNTTQCGMDGQDCRPFEGDSFAFVCPAGCRETRVLEPHYIGSQIVNYRSLVIGGPGTSSDSSNAVYRGDSFICAAALHAGVITDYAGGCGILSRIGEQRDFRSVSSHGIKSIGFPASFPLSFTFEQDETTGSCKDFRWTLLGLSIIVTTLLSTFVTSASTFFWSIFVGVFFHVALVSDPPYYIDYTNVVSIAVRRFLPAAFVGFVFHKYCIQHTLGGLRAPLERTIFWLGGCWVGALNNYTFDRIPISRLTPHDLKQQPGAITALLIIVGIILIIAIGQAYSFWKEGRMPRYLLFYTAVIILLLVLASIPGMNLRIHHYILALIFLPGTSLQTRPSLLYQGILVGLFINGIARWGFDSILQTPGQLLLDGELGSSIPHTNAPVITDNNITFKFGELADHFDGISIMVNDVLRFQAFKPRNMTFEWTKRFSNEPEYFRFAYVKSGTLGGNWYGDFSLPDVWAANGSWTPGNL